MAKNCRVSACRALLAVLAFVGFAPGGCNGVIDRGSRAPGAQGSVTVGGDSPAVNIDWRVAQRTFSRTRDGNVRSLRPTPELKQQIHTDPDVTLSGCLTESPRSPIQSWAWQVSREDGSVIAGVTIAGNQCTWDLSLRPDVYLVTLTVTTRDGETVSTTRAIRVRDYLVVSMGDSIASGEGNPDVPGSYPFNDFGALPGWADPRCRRSWHSGPAQAALALEGLDQRSSVTFVSVACSGASIGKGVLTPYAGQTSEIHNKLLRMMGPPGEDLPPQLEQVRDLLAGPRGVRTADALLLSAGANDLQFSDIAKGCLLGISEEYPNTCVDDVDGMCYPATTWVGRRLEGLDARYKVLGQSLRQRNENGTLPHDKVFITEYMDPVHGPGGAPCSYGEIGFNEAGVLAGVWGLPAAALGLGSKIGISPAESRWAFDQVIVPLNGMVEAAAGQNGWNFVGGIMNEFNGHGLCAGDARWIRQLPESLDHQGEEVGMLHPNELGHRHFGRQLARRMRSMLEEPLYTAVWQPGSGQQTVYSDLPPHVAERLLQVGTAGALTAYMVGGQLRYTLALDPARRDQAVLLDKSRGEFEARDRQLRDQGYRLTALSVHVRDEQPAYHALWEQTGAEQLALYGWGEGDMVREVERLAAEGMNMTLLTGYQVNGETLYSAAFERKHVEQAQLFGMRGSEIRARDRELRALGLQLVLTAPVLQGDRLVYAGVWQAVTGENHPVFDGLRADVTAKQRELGSSGWRLASLAAYVDRDHGPCAPDDLRLGPSCLRVGQGSPELEGCFADCEAREQACERRRRPDDDCASDFQACADRCRSTKPACPAGTILVEGTCVRRQLL
jgi:hypothetical protein